MTGALLSVLDWLGVTPAAASCLALAGLAIGTTLVIRLLEWLDQDIDHEYVSDGWLRDGRRRGL